MNTIFTLRPYATQTNIVLFHDYICPWCWVGWHQAQRLIAEYGVTFDWRAAELIPPSMTYEPTPPRPAAPNEPPRPATRFDLFLAAEGIPLASPRPAFVRSHAALLGAEYALIEEGKEAAAAYHEAIYRGYWEGHVNIADLDALSGLADAAGLNGAALIESVRAERYAENILEFDDDAYARGVRHVPTFIFNGEEQLAEAYYSDLAHAVERYLARVERFKEKK